MDIEIPPWLQWVSYLAGGEWPQGSETGMFRIKEYYYAAAEELEGLIPDLNRVRQETLSVLMGETAEAADEQFRMLFDGDYAVDKLADAIRALGDSAGYTGSEIEYSKLSILVGLALAAAEISYALAMSGPTWGGSLAMIPITELLTVMTIRQVVAFLIRRLFAKVRDMLVRTTVRRLVHEGFQEAGEELALAALQEGIIYGLQGDRYNVNVDRLFMTGVASTVGGGAGGLTAVPVANVLGPARTRVGAGVKGATTFFTAGIVGNIAGTLAVGGEFDPLMIVVSSTTSSIGGMRGAGVAPSRAGQPATMDPRTSPPGTGLPPGAGPPQGPLPVGPNGGPPTGQPQTNGYRTNGHGTPNGQAAQGAQSHSGASISEPNGAVNGIAAQHDPSTPVATPTTGEATATDDGAVDAGPSSAQSVDGETATQTSDGDTVSTSPVTAEGQGQDPTNATPVTDTTPAAPLSGQPPVGDSVVADPTVDQAATTPTVDDASSPTGLAPTAEPSSPAPHSQAAPATGVGTPSTPTAATPATSTPAASTPAAAASTPNQAPTHSPPPATPKKAAGKQVPVTPSPATPSAATPSDTAAAETTAARAMDTAAAPANVGTPQAGPEQSSAEPVHQAADEPAQISNDCVQRLAQRLSARYGRPIQLAELPSARGTRASALFQAMDSGADFATYADVTRELGKLKSGSSAIVTSAWAGGPRQGGHAYLAVKENGQLFLEDPDNGELTPWPPAWGQDSVLLSAVGYLDNNGRAVQALDDTRQLVAAAAVGEVQGSPGSTDGSPDGDHAPGDRWRDVVSPQMVADQALQQRIPPVQSAEELRNPLGSMEAGSERARDNALWWDGLTGAQQLALIEAYPQHIGNAEGISDKARDKANRLSLDRDRQALRDRSDRGERLTRAQRKELARLEKIDMELRRAHEAAREAGLGGPQLVAFDSKAFGGDGRALVSFGADRSEAESVSWHVPGTGMTIDQIGYCMGDALNHLMSTHQENPDLKAASIAWLGYDTPSGWKSWRAAGHKLAREGAAILYSDIKAFNAGRDARAAGGVRFQNNHIFAHSYGSTTASYAGQHGRMATDIRTVTLIGSPGAGPLRHAGEFGIGVENVYVAASSRDPFTALGGRTPGSFGRILGRGLGVDPAMASFEAQRVTAEFSAEMDRARNLGTHNAYYRFVDRTSDPPVRSESLANFGRIAAGVPNRVEFDAHRTVDERPWHQLGWRTIEPAAGRPLNHDSAHQGDRETRRKWNPRWRAEPTAAVEPAADGDAVTDERSPAEIVADALAQRGVDAAEDLMNPVSRKKVRTGQARTNARWWKGLTPEQREQLIVNDPQLVAGKVGIPPADLAVARARANAAWWKGLSPAERQELIKAHPREIGNSLGVYATDRDTANRLMLQRYQHFAAGIQAKLDRGERPSDAELKLLLRVNRIDAGLREAAVTAGRAGLDAPLLVAFDPLEFNLDGRAVVSFGDPDTADSVSWHVPGIRTTIDDLGHFHDPGFFYLPGALEHLQSTQREAAERGETINAASMLWIGYDAPNDSHEWRVLGNKYASDGGDILYADICSANAARDVWAGDGSHFSGNYVFGHSYGSTTTSFAGRDRRLANHIRAVTFLGSPGAGPLRHARDFGIGAENVYVASSSYDPVTALGGRTPEQAGRILGRGRGIDPAMDSFGAVRITSEFPAAMNTTDTAATHRSYYRVVDDTSGTPIRSESLANFGRISSGHGDQVHREDRRTVADRRWYQLGWRTVEPASDRQLRLDDGAGPAHSSNRSFRIRINPRWRAAAATETERLEGELEALENAPQPTPAPVSVPTGPAPSVDAAMVAQALALRGVSSADELMNPASQPTVRTGQERANARWWAGLTPAQRQDLIVNDPQRVAGKVGIPHADLAEARARANAVWWKGLTPDQRLELVRARPYQIGNSEGIYAADRDAANRRMLQRYRVRAAAVQKKLNVGERPSDGELDLLLRFNKIDTGLHSAELAARAAGLDLPLLMAFDPIAFGHDGRAVVSFGDPYDVDSVSWLVPGIRSTIESVNGFYLRGALDHLRSTMREAEAAGKAEGFSAASMLWIGYDAPNDSHEWRASGTKLAREGGDILYADIRAFNAVRDVWAGDGTHFSGNYIFGHSYGSTTTSFAGHGRRLADHVRAVTLVGSPGAGPLRHARDFGIGARMVFVASSSYDFITALGGRHADQAGRILGRGLGIDPAMDTFGGVRITAEFPAAMNTWESYATHRDYFAHVDTSTDPLIRTESSANFGRIAAGEHDGVHREEHRTVQHRPRRLPRTIEPAAGRPLRLDGDTGSAYSADRHVLQRFNPRWGTADAVEGQRLAAELADLDDAENREPEPIDVDAEATKAAVENKIPATDTEAEPEPETKVEPEPDPEGDPRRVADAALKKRVPPVQPGELRNSPTSSTEASARARNNHNWWAGLTEAEKQALIETYPRDIGNTEGIPPADRDIANRRTVQQLRDRADEIQARKDRFERPSRADRSFLKKFTRFDDALNKAGRDATRAGFEAPLLIAFDPSEFGGDGRAVLSFGHDTYTADRVSWHVPGVQTTLNSLFGFYTTCALNHLVSVREANAAAPDGSTQTVASIAWIGYDTPSGRKLWRAMGKKFARLGGDILFSDISAFNAGRDAHNGGDVRFTNNDIFGYSYGSTTTGFAGREGRLSNQVRTVSLIGSPGAGPQKRAGDFGIGADNVFVLSSSRDMVTALGGRTPNSAGRILGIGLGIDPAMESFGAVRVTAEAAPTMNRPLILGTHHTYYLGGEALVNLGRIGAGREHDVDREEHRAGGKRRGLLRTVEPAGDRTAGRFGNPIWLRGPNCGVSVADELSARYKRPFTLAAAPSRKGLPARALFEAANADADFTTYDAVRKRLIELGDGSSAVLTSRWQGGRTGGHAYLAVNDGDEIFLIDRHSPQRRSGWPPYWGQHAVTQTAVGYLDSEGQPAGRTDAEAPLQLDAADKIGHVRGSRDDADFVRRQAEYRALDPVNRRVDTRYAEPLANVVDNADDMAGARQLARDLSGLYGPYRIELEANRFGTEVMLTGKIFNGDTGIGTIQRIFNRDADGNLVASHTGLVIKEEFKHLRGKGFSRSLTSELERYYVHSGVDRVELRTHDKGGYAWARQGFTWNLDPAKLLESLNSIKASAATLSRQVGADARAALDQLVQRLDPDNPRLPEPIDIANLATDTEPELGRRLLEGVGNRKLDGINYVRYMPIAADPTPQSRSRFGAWLKRAFGSRTESDQNCAHVIANVLSDRHDRRFRVPRPRSSMGVPAWALFEAVESASRFETYDEVADTLRDLGVGSSAVLVSRWAAGRQPGHAYLALNNDNQIYLYDPHTRQLTPWPPPWDADTVARTAVGYLERNGDALRPLHDVPLQLAAADTIGDVKGPADDSNFSRRQADYRRQDPTTRHAQARYAEPLGDVLVSASLDPASADQLAADLSGVYGQCRIAMTHEHFDSGDVADQVDAIARGIPTFGPSIYGDVLFGDQKVGTIHWWIKPDKLGVLTVEHQLFVEGDFPVREFTDAVARELEPYLLRSGAVRIDSTVSGEAAFAAAARGEVWHPDPDLLGQSLNEVKRSADELWALASDATRGVLDDIVARLDPNSTAIPTPIELAALAARDVPDLGRQLLEGTGIHDPDFDETRPETQLHTVNDLRAERRTWLPADQQAADPADRAATRFDPVPADAGVPAVGEVDVRSHPDFVSRQQDYRAGDPATRRMDANYAELLGVVVDNPSPAAAAQLAADLSGVYGNYRVVVEVSSMQDEDGASIFITADILRGDDVVGGIGRSVFRDGNGHLVVENTATTTYSDDVPFEAVAREIDVALEPYYWRSGVHRVEEEAVDGTGAAAAGRGFTWDPDPVKLADSLDKMTQSARALGRRAGEETRAALRDVVAVLDPAHPDFPMPIDLDRLSVTSEPNLGARLLAGANWWGVKYRPAGNTGDVAGSFDDPDFLARQAEYRVKLPNIRQVEARYAQPLGDVVDSASPDAAAQLGGDLTGLYGPHAVEFEGYIDGTGRVVLEGDMLSGGTEIGAVAFTFERDDAGNLNVLHELHMGVGAADGAAASQRLIAELAPIFIASGIDRIVSTTHGTTTFAAIDLSESWDTDPQRLQDTVDNLKRSARRLLPDVAGDARPVLEDVVRRLNAGGDQLPSPVELASLETDGEPDLGRRLLDGTGLDHDGTGVSTVKKLWNLELLAGHNCGPWALAALSARYGIPFPLSVAPSERGVPARALFEAIKSSADFMTYAEVETLLSQLKPTTPGRPGPAALLVSSWTSGAGHGGHAYLAFYDGQRVQLVDAFTGGPSPWPPYWGQGAVSRTAVGILNSEGVAVRGLEGGRDPLAAAEAIGYVHGPPRGPDALGLPNYPPHSLSEAEASAVYRHGELRMRDIGEQMRRDGVSAERRARILSEHRNSLRGWTRELLSNRATSDWLAANDSNLSFDELVTRNQERGLEGDAVYEAIVRTATHSRYEPGTLSDIETTAVYSEFELRLRDLNVQLIGEGVNAEERAGVLSRLRSALRGWTRELMSNRQAAEWLEANESSPTFDDLVARYRERGLTGDAVYEAIVDSATHSHYAPGTLSDFETRTVYTQLELRMRDRNQQMIREGVDARTRAVILSDYRRTIRDWTRGLMSNREYAQWLADNETNPTLEELVEKHRSRGKTGDEIYEAIIESSMRSRGSVNDALGIDPDNPPPLPPMRGPEDPPERSPTDE